MAEVLVLVEHAEGAVKKVTAELITAARALGEPAAVVVGAFSVILWQLNETTAALAREENEKQQRKLEKQSGVPGENDDFGQNDFSLAGDYEEPEELTISNSNAED